jgi:rhomboid protease GluP
MNLRIRRGNELLGTFPLTEANSLLRSGAIQPTDLAAPEGSENWTPVSQVLASPPLDPQTEAVSGRNVGTFAVLAILGINVWVFVLMTYKFGFKTFSPREAAQWGGLHRALFLAGDYWRILTANYVHFDLKHLVLNMIAFLSWGGYVALRLGTIRFSLLYTFAGLGGSAASLLAHSNAVCAGASGAITGLLGALLAFHLSGDSSISGKELKGALIFNALYSVIMPSVDWAGHGGGFVVGFLGAFVSLSTVPERKA